MRARSEEFPLDITATNGYPFTAHTIASPVPGVSAGEFNHGLSGFQNTVGLLRSSIICRAIRSFLE